jgi:hypothetical protein
MRHRDDRVHKRLPAVAGLNPEILFSRTDADTAFPPQVRDALKAAGYPLTGERSQNWVSQWGRALRFRVQRCGLLTLICFSLLTV